MDRAEMEVRGDASEPVEVRLRKNLHRPEPGIIEYHGMTMWIEEAADEIERLQTVTHGKRAAELAREIIDVVADHAVPNGEGGITVRRQAVGKIIDLLRKGTTTNQPTGSQP